MTASTRYPHFWMRLLLATMMMPLGIISFLLSIACGIGHDAPGEISPHQELREFLCLYLFFSSPLYCIAALFLFQETWIERRIAYWVVASGLISLVASVVVLEWT